MRQVKIDNRQRQDQFGSSSIVKRSPGKIMAKASTLTQRVRKVAAALVLVFLMLARWTRADELQLHSKWDEDLLNFDLGEVDIKPCSQDAAWNEITQNYLLRCNFYGGSRWSSENSQFTFKKPSATGKELLDAFVAAFPACTYTQDADTGVIWIHPKSVAYHDILPQRVRIKRPSLQIPMASGVLSQLVNLLSPAIGFPFNASGDPHSGTFLYNVDLADGVYTARDILNFCCVAEPTKAFHATSWSRDGLNRVTLYPVNLFPQTPRIRRTSALRFWQIEIGGTNEVWPSLEEVGSAMSDPNPRKRWAGRAYLDATLLSVRASVLLSNEDAERALWSALVWCIINS